MILVVALVCFQEATSRSGFRSLSRHPNLHQGGSIAGTGIFTGVGTEETEVGDDMIVIAETDLTVRGGLRETTVKIASEGSITVIETRRERRTGTRMERLGSHRNMLGATTTGKVARKICGSTRHLLWYQVSLGYLSSQEYGTVFLTNQMLCYKFCKSLIICQIHSICVGIGSRFFIVQLLSNLLWLLVIAKTHMCCYYTLLCLYRLSVPTSTNADVL